MPTINDLRQQAATIKNATQVGENTATRVGTTFETIADLLEGASVGQGVPSVDLSQLNALRTPADQTTTNPTIYNVTTLHNLSSTTIKVGTLFIFSDGGRAVVTQILLSNYQVDGGGNISSPNTSQITMYYRMFNIVQETWSAWTLYAGGGGGGTIDPYPVSGSDNAVASNGVFEGLQKAAPEVNINDINDLDDFVDMQTGVASTYTIKAYHNLSSTWLRVGVLMVFANQANNTLTQICISNCMVDGGGNLIPNYTTNAMNVFYRFKQFSGNPPEGMTIGVWTTWAKFGDSGYQPDNEDIDLNANDQLQFANKAYDASAFSGLGRVYLRKNIVQLNLTDKYFDGFVNDVLVQDVGTSSTPDAILFDTTRKMFVARVGLLYYVDWSSDEDYNPITRDVNWNYNGNFYRWNGEELVQWDKTINQLTQAMVNTANTIYHIQYDYDLNGQTITLPAGCVLEFDGGSLKNGTLSGTFNIISKGVCLYEVGFDSAILDTVSLSWFDVQANVPCNDIFNSAFAIKCKTINIPSYDFPILVKEPNTSELGTISCIRIKEGEKVIDFNNNTIKLQPTSSGVCKIVSVECSNATIKNLNILGDVSSHTGTTGEVAHGLSLIFCSNVTLENINVAECWGDGICFIDLTIGGVGYYPQNISVINCHSLRNRRNALSIEAGRELKFLQCEFAYTGSIVGTSPFAGLDIEPWHDVEIAKVEGVTFSECSFHDNIGNGEVILSKASAFNNAIINNIIFNNCSIYHSTTNQSTHLILTSNAGAVNIIGGVYGTPNKNGIINVGASSFIINGAMVYGRILTGGGNVEITKSNILACDANVSWNSALQLGSVNAKIIDSNITSIVNTCLYIAESTVEFNGCHLYDANEITSDDRQSLIYQSVVSMISCSLRLGSAIRLRAFAGSNHHFSIENSKWEKIAIGVSAMFINALKAHIISNTYDVEIKNTDLLCSSGQIFSRVDDSDDVKIYIDKFPNNASIISYNEFRLLPTNDVDGDFPIINAGTIVMRDYVKNHLTQYQAGFKFFDKTLNKPLFWNGVNFVDANGNVLNTQKTAISGWTPEKAIYCNQGVGSAYDTSPKGLQGARYVIIPVVQGNVYVINGQGGSSPRLWCFADANNIILSVAETYAITHFDYLVIVPPSGATQLIINNYSGYTEDCYELVP